MELFVVKNAQNKVLEKFDNKADAKAYRDTGADFRVSRGKDNLASPKPSRKRGWKKTEA